MSTLSTIAMYDDLRRCEYVLMHGLAEEGKNFNESPWFCCRFNPISL